MKIESSRQLNKLTNTYYVAFLELRTEPKKFLCDNICDLFSLTSSVDTMTEVSGVLSVNYLGDQLES